jgi:hypothetical protein
MERGTPCSVHGLHCLTLTQLCVDVNTLELFFFFWFFETGFLCIALAVLELTL